MLDSSEFRLINACPGIHGDTAIFDFKVGARVLGRIRNTTPIALLGCFVKGRCECNGQTVYKFSDIDFGDYMFADLMFNKLSLHTVFYNNPKVDLEVVVQLHNPDASNSFTSFDCLSPSMCRFIEAAPQMPEQLRAISCIQNMALSPGVPSFMNLINTSNPKPNKPKVKYRETKWSDLFKGDK